jgi:hypothetical protein
MNSGEMLANEVLQRFFTDAMITVMVLLALLLYAKPLYASTYINTVVRPIIGRQIVSEMHVDAYDLWRLPGTRVSTGYWLEKDGTQYDGEFVDGSMTGDGALSFPDGTTKTGTFVFGKMFGHGTIYAKDGSVVSEGEFWADELRSPPTEN